MLVEEKLYLLGKLIESSGSFGFGNGKQLIEDIGATIGLCFLRILQDRSTSYER
jgi:hypothetical protein